MRFNRRAALPIAAILLTGCTEAPPVVDGRDEPFVGIAYPRRHKPIDVPAAGLAIVTNGISDTLSVLDLGTGKPIDEVPVGRDPVTVDGPGRILVDERAGAAYVLLTYPQVYGELPHANEGLPKFGYVQRLDLRDLSITGEARLDPGPGDILFSSDTSQLIATSYDWDSEGVHLDPQFWTKPLDVLDIASFGLARPPEHQRIPMCTCPNGMALSRPDGSRVFAACQGDDTLAIADLHDPAAPVKRIPVGDQPGTPFSPNYEPFSVALSPDGNTLVVTTLLRQDLRFFDVASETFQLAKTLPLQGYPMYPTYSADGSRLFVPTVGPDALMVLDPGKGNVEITHRDFTPAECGYPFRVALHGPDLLLVCRGHQKTKGRVIELDGVTLSTIWSADVGVGPDAVAIVHGGAP